MKYDEGSLSGFRQNNTLSMQKGGGWRQGGREGGQECYLERDGTRFSWNDPELCLDEQQPSPLFYFPLFFQNPFFSHHTFSLFLPWSRSLAPSSHFSCSPTAPPAPSSATLLFGFAADIMPCFWSFVRICLSLVRRWRAVSICKTGCVCIETTAAVHACSLF